MSPACKLFTRSIRITINGYCVKDMTHYIALRGQSDHMGIQETITSVQYVMHLCGYLGMKVPGPGIHIKVGIHE